MPTALVPDTWDDWKLTHRCPVCDAKPETVTMELINEERQLKPEYRYLAETYVAPEFWQTEVVGAERELRVVCEENHVLICRYWDWKGPSDG